MTQPGDGFGFPGEHDYDGTAAVEFSKAAFDGIEFPYTNLTVKGSIRYAKHEFPHSPGAEIEKMGRNAYEIAFSAWFHDIPGSALARAYPSLSSRLEQLRERYEKELTADLVVPTVGTIKAVCVEWEQKFDPKTTSGQTFELKFIEDQDVLTLRNTVDLGGLEAIQEKSDALFAAAALADFKKQNAIGFFQQLNDAITAVQGFFGQADAMSRLVEGKIRALDQLISWGDAQVDELQNPTNYLVVNALHDLWGSVRAMQENIVEAREEIRLYKVPRKMSVNQISTAIYGSSERGFELMQLNDFKDTLEVQAGTDVRYLHKELVLFGQKTGLSTSLNV